MRKYSVVAAAVPASFCRSSSSSPSDPFLPRRTVNRRLLPTSTRAETRETAFPLFFHSPLFEETKLYDRLGNALESSALKP